MKRCDLSYLQHQVEKTFKALQCARVSRIKGATEKARRKWVLAVARLARARPVKRQAQRKAA